MITNHIARKLYNSSAAESFYKEVWSTIDSLTTMPYRYQEVEQNIRKVKVRKFNIFYSIDEQNNLINILHVLYQGRDISQIANW